MKLRKYAMPCFILLLLVFYWAGYKNSDDDIADYCYAINQELKDLDFFKAIVTESTITLYDNENSLLDEIPFDGYDSRIKILYIRRADNTI